MHCSFKLYKAASVGTEHAVQAYSKGVTVGTSWWTDMVCDREREGVMKVGDKNPPPLTPTPTKLTSCCFGALGYKRGQLECLLAKWHHIVDNVLDNHHHHTTLCHALPLLPTHPLYLFGLCQKSCTRHQLERIARG